MCFTLTPNQKGYTLIELLLYMSIVGSLLIAVSLFFATAVDSRVKNQSISEVDQQGAAALEYMTQTIRGASSVSAPAAGGSSSSLTLIVPTSGLSPTVFDLSAISGGSAAIQVKEGAGAVLPLTNSKILVSNLTFKNLTRSGTPGVVQISFMAALVNASGKNEYDYQKTFTGTAALRWPN